MYIKRNEINFIYGKEKESIINKIIKLFKGGI